MIEIDGSLGEGGGQVVRTAVSLSAITGESVEVVRIRERRERPGLQPQHLAAVRAAASVCDATVVGDAVGSRHLLFEPGRAPRPGEYSFDIRTAGATTLVLQTVLVPLLVAPGDSFIEVIGGTHQPMSPSADYLQHVYAPALRRLGAEVEVEYGPAGYYPRGGGRIRATVVGATLDPAELVIRGARESLDAFVVTSGLRDDVAERGSAMIAELVPDARMRVLMPRAFSRGAAVTIVTRHQGGIAGFSSIGRPGFPMEKVAAKACALFLEWDRGDAACDERLADQLVLPAALARGPSRWSTPRITEHLRTVLAVVKAFLPIDYRFVDGVVELSPG